MYILRNSYPVVISTTSNHRTLRLSLWKVFALVMTTVIVGPASFVRGEQYTNIPSLSLHRLPSFLNKQYQYHILQSKHISSSTIKSLLFSLPSIPSTTTRRKHFVTSSSVSTPLLLKLQGGAQEHTNYNNDDDDDDEERYSRQYYTLGARAHSLVRSSTIIIDGPLHSGLLFESIKNLALSGVGSIVLLHTTSSDDDDVDDDDDDCTTHDVHYHDSQMDDLGYVYHNCARAECASTRSPIVSRDENNSSTPKHNPDDITNNNNNSLSQKQDLQMILDFIRQLNPSVKVQTMKRSEFIQLIQNHSYPSPGRTDDSISISTTNPIFLCIDRPQSTQVVLNNICRQQISSKMDHGINHDDPTKSCGKMIPFISIETAGVFGRTFCDFGDLFHVVDEDGETPKATLFDRVEIISRDDDNDNNNYEFIVHCIEGEKHDVSKGDLISFQIKNESKSNHGESDSSILNQIQFHVTYVKTPTCFKIKMIPNQKYSNTMVVSLLNRSVHSFSRVKVPKQLSFYSLDDALELFTTGEGNALFAPSDLDKSFDSDRRLAVMMCFSALDQFVKENHRLPHGKDDIQEFESLVHSLLVQTNIYSDGGTKKFAKIVSSFVKYAPAKFTPLLALYGSIGAQEVLKAASGLYNPIKQFLLYDCDEVLIRSKVEKANNNENDESSSRSQKGNIGVKGMTYIFGKKFMKTIATRKIFVVGSGAIGCEILKNLSAIGAGTNPSKGGKIILTDNDSIEKSNLSRQLLFRDADVGKFKSIAAQEAIQRFNPLVKIESHTRKVGEDELGSGIFNDQFWTSNVDVVLNALDNVEARLFIDSQCVANRKGLVDAGTLGAKGNVQVVVPGKSESYGSSVDPPEPTIPVCTLKNFPYEISHTIQWGRDLFDGLFTRRPTQVNENIDSLSSQELDEFSSNLLIKLGEDSALEVAEEMFDDFLVLADQHSDYITKVKELSLTWSVNLAKKLFYKSIKDLLKQHPLDSLDDDGKPFWSGTRRPPKLLLYTETNNTASDQDIINRSLIDFVRSTSRLRIETYLTKDVIDAEDKYQYSKVSIEEAKIALQRSFTSRDDNEDSSKASENPRGKELYSEVVSNLKQPQIISKDTKKQKTNQNYLLNVATFEKDDESNGHVAFITAASNLRAISYGITPVDATETRRIAGRIVPAMITTTAFVSALSCIELIKLFQHDDKDGDLSTHRNAFVNLALPFFAFTVPVPAEESVGWNDESFTIWDRITVKENEKAFKNGGLTLRRLIRQIQKKLVANDYSDSTAEISSVSFGQYMLFANFLHGDDDSILDKPVIDLVKEAILGDIDDNFARDEDGKQAVRNLPALQKQIESIEKRMYIDLSVIAEDSETGEEIELQPVRIVKWRDTNNA